MTLNATLNCNDPLVDRTLEDQLKDVFASEKATPGKSVMKFIMGYAADFESIRSEMIGTMDFIKN